MKINTGRLPKIGVGLLILFIALANSSNPPNGRTGAPGDGLCSDSGCHSNPGSFTGNIVITGLPSSITPSTTYPIMVTINNFSGNASRAGFQLVALDDSNLNIGTITGNGEVDATTVGNGRIYAEHSPAKNFSGGTVAFNFNWISPTTGTNVTMYASGNIANGSGTSGDVIVTSTASGSFAVATPPNVSVSSSSNVGCNGGSDGQATAMASDGTPGYTYSWSSSPAQSGQTAMNLLAGVYTVTVTDAASMTATAAVTITEPSAITCNISNQSNVLCNGGSDGSATVSCSGGTGVLSYLWSNGDMTNSASGLSAGNHTVTVTDANNCETTSVVNIIEPSSISVNTNSTNESGNGANDGTAIVFPTGGTGSYDYIWTNNEMTADIANLSPGIYTVTVSDANNCITSTSVVISPFNCSITSSISTFNDVSCFGGNDGESTVSVTGGAMPLSYSWSNSDNGATASNLSAGTYTVTVTDANNCVAISSVTVGEPNALAATGNSVSVSCNGGNDGEANVTVTGGTGVYSYLWSNGDNTDTSNALSAGSYTVTITDANDCTTTHSTTITEPTAIVVSLGTVVDATDGNSNGSIDISVTGGTAGYMYSWLDDNSNMVSTDMNPTGLIAGSYTVEVTDGNGCQVTSSAAVVDNIVTSIIDASLEKSLSIFPNPANDWVNIEWLDAFLDARLVIIDTKGSILMEQELETGNNLIPLEKLNKGVYLFRIQAGNGIIVKKVIID